MENTAQRISAVSRLKILLSRFPTIKRFVKAPLMMRRKLFRREEGARFLRQRYEQVFGKPLELTAPRTFTERIFCKMIERNYHDDALATRLSDKLAVRDWVAERIGPQYLSKVYLVADDPAKLLKTQLPARFVIKTNHGSGQVLVCSDGTPPAGMVAKVRAWLSHNYYWNMREGQYYGIAPKVYVEEMLSDGMEDGPLDYRFWCFGGVVATIQVDDHSHAINPFYDPQWNLMDLRYREGAKERAIPRPQRLDKMLRLAECLSKGFDFVRVDFYHLPDRIVFGEMTFTPVSGHLSFQPAAWDMVLGDLWEGAGRTRLPQHELAVAVEKVNQPSHELV